MIKRISVIFSVFSLAIVLSSTAFARDPKWSGLSALAISPDGKTLATGGQNRVLYVLDGDTLEVRSRKWLAARIGALAFSKDGSVLAVEDDDETLHLLQSDSLEPLKTIDNTGYIDTCSAADLLAGVAKAGRNSEIRFVNMSDGSEQNKVALPEKTKVASLAFSPDYFEGSQILSPLMQLRDQDQKNLS